MASFNLKKSILLYFFYILIVFIFSVLFIKCLPIFSFDDKYKVVKSLSEKEDNFYSFLKENNYIKEYMNKKTILNFNGLEYWKIKSFIYENKISERYFEKYKVDSLEDLADRITVYNISDSELSYFTSHNLNSFIRDYYENDGYLSVYEFNLLKLYHLPNSPIVSEPLVRGISLYSDNKNIKKFMHNGIVFEKDSLKLLLAFQEIFQDEYPEFKDNRFYIYFSSTNVLSFLFKPYLTQISEIEKMYPLYSDYEIDILKRKYEKDNFVSEVEASYLLFLLNKNKDKIFLSKKDEDYMQFAAKFAIENNFILKDEIIKEINSYGFVRIAFAPELEKIFVLNDKNMSFKSSKRDSLKYLFEDIRPLSNYKIRSLEFYYCNDVSFKSNINIDEINNLTIFSQYQYEQIIIENYKECKISLTQDKNV